MQTQANALRDRLHRLNNQWSYQRNIDDANAIIAQAIVAADGGNIAVAVSGGKDSVAMAHLVAQQCRPLIIYNDSGLELPQSIGIVAALSDRLALDMVVAKGNAIALEVAGKDSNAAIEKPVQQALKKNAIELEFVGLRKAESRRRRMVVGKRGPMYRSKRWGCLIAWPMRHWRAADVFAYIDEHSLPLHPDYLLDAYVDRDDIRVSWAYDPERITKGEAQLLRTRHPQIFRRLRDMGILDNAL